MCHDHDHALSRDLFARLCRCAGRSRPPGPRNTEARLDRRDRNEFVWLSGRWGRDALLGSKNVVIRDKNDNTFGTYDPQPFQVQDIRLTSFGGSMQSEGTWDPPYIRPRPGRHDPNAKAFALSIEQWGHRSTLARTHFERIEYRDWLLPFGFRATLIKLTRRENDDWGGYQTAADIQRYYIKCVEPVLQFPLVGQPAESVNGFCQPEQFELLLPNDLQIDDPGTGIQGHGMSAFWIRSGDGGKRNTGDPWKFDLQIGVGGRAQCPLVFVDNTTTHDIGLLTQVANEYNGSTAPTIGNSRLFRKGKTASELRYMGHTLTDNRRGLVVNAMVTHADGYAEREAAKAMIKDARQAVADPKTEVTLGADKGYDAAEFIEELQRRRRTSRVAVRQCPTRSPRPRATRCRSESES